MSRVGWVDATGGVSGDMLLGACLDAGAPLPAVQAALDRLALPEQVTVTVDRARRAGLAAARADVAVTAAAGHRHLADVLALLDRLDEPVRSRAADVFRALAAAEARVHGTTVDEVHFHEVGALDSIADVVGVVSALHTLELDTLTCSPIALGGGRVNTEHGPIPVPGPAVVELLRAAQAPGVGGPIELELATPTGVALMTTLASSFGPMPALRPTAVGIGAGGRDPAGHANVTRLVIGATDDAAEREPAAVLDANVDDLDPRLWPQLLTDLLGAGAQDAWLTPILMKKGRPAYTLSVLCPPDRAGALERLVLTHTTTIGVRRYPVTRQVLPREWVSVEVLGAPVRIKVARLDGEVVNAVPEYEDVARLAAERGVPAKTVLAAAVAAAEGLRGGK